MAETGGSATQSGILFQNSVAALYLGRLCDVQRRPVRDQVFQVEVEGLYAVDDIVVTFADYHREFIQVKETLRRGTKEWRDLWQAFANQFSTAAFKEGADRLALYLGEYAGFARQLSEACEKAGTSLTYGIWRNRLSQPQQAICDEIEAALRRFSCTSEPLTFFASIKVEVWHTATIERDYVPKWIPASNVSESMLFRLLRDKAARHARTKAIFKRVELRHELEVQDNVRISHRVTDGEVTVEVTREQTLGELPETMRVSSGTVPRGPSEADGVGGDCTFLDHTTLFGAARALDTPEIRRSGLPLTALLSLSQLIEALVLWDDLRCETGDTPPWAPYLEALSKSSVGRLLAAGTIPIRPAEGQCDASQGDIADAVSWSIKIVEGSALLPLFWAARFRHAALGTIDGMHGRRNETLERYLEITRSTRGTEFDDRLRHVEQTLEANEIEPHAWLVLVRGRLLQQWTSRLGHHYFPHYSRQPLLLVNDDPDLPLQQWNMTELGDIRREILLSNDPSQKADPLADWLSPVFLACITRARKPEDILLEACELRNHDGARAFRKELALVVRSKDNSERELYLKRSLERLRDVGEHLSSLVGNDIAQVSPTPLPYPFNWQWGWTDRQPIERGNSVMFLANLLRRSLGIRRAQPELERVFGVSCRYDIDLLASGAPRDFVQLKRREPRVR